MRPDEIVETGRELAGKWMELAADEQRQIMPANGIMIDKLNPGFRRLRQSQRIRKSPIAVITLPLDN
ncbi:hypothetical protein D3C87_2109040 [compost metagenome]